MAETEPETLTRMLTTDPYRWDDVVVALGTSLGITRPAAEVLSRWLLLLIASGLTGAVVALCGPIGFVGLVVPHITRWLLGTVGGGNMLFCALLGGNFLVLCDLLARLLYPPAGLPVGLVTALFGVPFFVYLLRKQGA